jgi:Holliday junction DNA helicase RuvB
MGATFEGGATGLPAPGHNEKSAMPRERLVSPELISKEEESFNRTLRPATLEEYVGQRKVVEKLSIALEASRRRGEALEHVLFFGPPGLGKTTLAYIIANAMESKIVTTSGPALERTGDLMGILTNLGERDILFIDEIHRLPASIEEFLYPAMEDFRVDFVVDKGMYAKTINIPLKRFTLAAATTRAGSLSAPLRNRFGLFYHLDFYEPEDLHQIIMRSAGILEASIRSEGAFEIARRSRGTPRVANRLLRRVRDFADVRATGEITPEVALQALQLEGVDDQGLDDLDRNFLRTIITLYGGGPVGVEALSATLNEEIDTLVDMVEPYLLRQGFISRTKSGRRANERAYSHLRLPGIARPVPTLFDSLSPESDQEEKL